VTLRLFRRGGESILNAIEAQGYDTLTRRPVVTKAAKVKLLGRAFVEKMVA
jgi:phytoene/squalene synthetase